MVTCRDMQFYGQDLNTVLFASQYIVHIGVYAAFTNVCSLEAFIVYNIVLHPDLYMHNCCGQILYFSHKCITDLVLERERMKKKW